MKATTGRILSALADLDRTGIQGLPIALDLYPRESLEAATAAFAPFCHVRLVDGAKGAMLLWLDIREELRHEARAILGAFLSFLLEHACRKRWLGRGAADA